LFDYIFLPLITHKRKTSMHLKRFKPEIPAS